MANGLASVAALALVGIGLVNRMEVVLEADLASAHLGDGRADRPVCAIM